MRCDQLVGLYCSEGTDQCVRVSVCLRCIGAARAHARSARLGFPFAQAVGWLYWVLGKVQVVTK